MGKGTFYFFTGLAGAGKTTIGQLFYNRQKAKKNDILFFDGDQTRIARGEVKPSDYSLKVRLESVQRCMGMYKLITDQGIDLVCCSISMFDEVRDWYRAIIENYREIYIKVSMETLYRRDQKGLYTKGVKQVVGVDLPWDEPKHPDVVVENEGDETPDQIVDRLEKLFGLT